MRSIFIFYTLFFVQLYSCKKPQETYTVGLETITESVYASGIVKSKQQYEVTSTVNGIIAEVFVEEGALIKKGDALMRIENTTAKLNTDNVAIAADYATMAANSDKLNELKNNITVAQLKMENEALLLKRQQNLWAEQIGTRNELDQRELSYKNAVNAKANALLRYNDLLKQIQFQEKQAQKNLQISKTITSDYIIKAENEGRVYRMLKEKGEMVNMQNPVALIGDEADFILELQVDEYDIASIKPDQKIVLNMDSYKGKVFEAVVTKIIPLMNERSKSFTVEAMFVQQPPTLFPFLTCEANIIIQEQQKVITIPRNYLIEGDQVMMADKTLRKITTGLKDYQKVAIVKGLVVNEVILKPED